MPCYLLQELILLYACWSIAIFFFTRTKFIDQLDMVIVWLIRIVGIVYLLQLPVNMIYGDQDAYAWINRYTGPYCLTAVFPLLVYSSATQSLWWGYFRNAKYWRLTFGVLLLIATFFNVIVILLSSLSGTGVSGSWTMAYQSSFLHIQSMILFSFIAGIGYFIIREK